MNFKRLQPTKISKSSRPRQASKVLFSFLTSFQLGKEKKNKRSAFVTNMLKAPVNAEKKNNKAKFMTP